MAREALFMETVTRVTEGEWVREGQKAVTRVPGRVPAEAEEAATEAAATTQRRQSTKNA